MKTHHPAPLHDGLASGDPRLTTIEDDCADCQGTGTDKHGEPCETCEGEGYLAAEVLWIRAKEPRF